VSTGHSSRRLLHAIVRLACVPAAFSAGFLVFASIFPVRLDLRTFQSLARLSELGLDDKSARVLLLTGDNDREQAELFEYALPQYTFPSGYRAWLTLKENVGDRWSPGIFAVDGSGRVWVARKAPEVWELWSTEISIHGWTLLYESETIRLEFERRLPMLAGANRVMTARPHTSIVVRRPFNWEFTSARWLRLTCVLGILLSAVSLLPSAPGIAVFCGIGVSTATVYCVGEISPGYNGISLFAVWTVASATVVILRPIVEYPRFLWWAIAGFALYVGAIVVRLDYDIDTYTTYIPVAKSYYWLGHHDLKSISVQSPVQGDVYPPGYSMFVALPMWVLDLPRDTAMHLGLATSAAILLYRCSIAVVNLAFFAQAASILRTAGVSVPHAWAMTVFASFLAIPIFVGKHVSAETLLIPAFGAAIAAILCGRRHNDSVVYAGGLYVAMCCMFIKQEGFVYFAFLAIPATISVRSGWSVRRELALGGVVLAGAIPLVIWKMTGPAANRSFRPLADLMLIPTYQVVPVVLKEAVRSMLSSNISILLAVVLPAAIAYRWSVGRGGIREIVFPCGIAMTIAAWTAVYLLTNLPVSWHVQTSYSRLMLGPAVAAVVYTLETLAISTSKDEVG